MFKLLHEHYGCHIDRIEHLMREEVTHWQWDVMPQMKEMVVGYLSRSGKRLRPLLVLIFADLHFGQLERNYCAAAALEVYHTATLIYDDIQDNSEFRRGLPCAHITASTSTAMNLAGIVRSLMYHFLHRSAQLNVMEKLEVHQRLDTAATCVTLGQSIDIGWHEGWYPTHREFPYEPMIQWKSATLFGCAAAIGSLLSGCDSHTVNSAEKVGVEMGLLFQKIDDYLDVFGDPEVMRRPLYNDFREGKVTYPVICLLYRLSAHHKTGEVGHILQRLAERDAHKINWQWLVDLMFEYQVDQYLRQEFKENAKQLITSIEKMGTNTSARENLRLFIDSLVTDVSDRRN